MKIHYIQHVPFEGLGTIEKWTEENNFPVTGTKLYESHQFPSMDSFDTLIIMGGPMGVYDEDKHPWLIEEKNFIKKAIEAEKKVIGICLGAQLIADVMGAKVYKNPHREIGWFPLNLTREVLSSKAFEGFPVSPVVFHWHGDTFDLPDGSVLIGSTPACRNQGFILGDKIIGMQFHMDTTNKGAEDLIEHCRDEIITGDYIQDAGFMLEQHRYFNRLEGYLYKFLDNLLI